MNEKQILLIDISLFLNLIYFRLANITHFEYREIKKNFQNFFFTIIFIKFAQNLYVKKFQRFLFLLYWSYIQLSKRHLKI